LTRSQNVPRFSKMAKLYAVPKAPKPDAPADRVRKRAKQSARDWPCCGHCGGREVVQAAIGNVKNKLCVVCLMAGRRVVVE
jgi:hypothetical protein